MAKKRVFISFEFDNDKVLKDFIVGLSKRPDSPFEISDFSMKEAAPQPNWAIEARSRIKRCARVIVMVGPQTHRAPGVLKEVEIARQAGIPVVQIIGYRDGDYRAVSDAGQLYRWNWENLKKLLA